MNDGMGRDIVCKEKGAGPLVTLGSRVLCQRGVEGRPHLEATVELITHFPPTQRGPLYKGFLTGTQAPEHPQK